MKNNYLLLSIIMLLAVGGLKAQWSFVGQQGFNNMSNATIAIDTGGVPYILGEGNNAVNVLSHAGTTWEAAGNTEFGNIFGFGPLSLAISPTTNVPYALFEDNTSGANAGAYSVMVLPTGISTWTYLSGSTQFTSTNVETPTLAFDHSGHLYLAYIDNYNGNDGGVSVQKYGTSSWSFLGSESFYSQSDEVSFAISANDSLFVAFRDYNTQLLTVMKFNGSTWVNVGSPGFSPGDVGNIAISVNSQGTPFVAFQDDTRSSVNPGISVMSYSPASGWALITHEGPNGIPSPDTSANSAPLSIVFDKCNNLFVNFGGVYVDEFNGTNWVTLSNNNFDLSTIAPGSSSEISTTMALDSLGNPMIAGSNAVAYYYGQAVIAGLSYTKTGNEITLEIDSGNLNSDTIYNWYTGSCGGTLVSAGQGSAQYIQLQKPSATTTYYVQGAGTCVLSECEQVTVVIVSGIPQIEETSLKLYPNPANDYLTVENSYQPFKNIAVTDLTGRLIINMPASTETVNIKTAGLAAGSYLVKIINADNSSLVQKIEIIH